MSTVVHFLSLLTLMLAGSSATLGQSCDYHQELVSGTTYYVYNPGYPKKFWGRQSCQWHANSTYRVRLTCDEFDIPWSENCSLDVLTVKISNAPPDRYCGNTNFTVESVGNEMTITLSTSFWSTGGKFLCRLQAIDKKEEDDDCRCGWKNPMRIVGGSDTGVNEYPMMAGLVNFLQRLLYCGATIISDKYVLTAAHCMVKRNISDLGVVVGEHDVSTGSDTNATVLFRVESSQIHPGYTVGEKNNDIAVVKVAGTIKFSNEVGPACLPFQHQPDTFAGSFVDLLGWGTTEFAGAKSDILQEVTLSVITNNKCRRSYPSITNSEMCTLGEGKDACQFDSGGPVLWQNPTTKQLVHVGIITSGGDCGGDDPGVNTRVGAFMDWITEVTPDAWYCMNE